MEKTCKRPLAGSSSHFFYCTTYVMVPRMPSYSPQMTGTLVMPTLCHAANILGPTLQVLRPSKWVAERQISLTLVSDTTVVVAGKSVLHQENLGLRGSGECCRGTTMRSRAQLHTVSCTGCRRSEDSQCCSKKERDVFDQSILLRALQSLAPLRASGAGYMPSN